MYYIVCKKKVADFATHKGDAESVA